MYHSTLVRWYCPSLIDHLKPGLEGCKNSMTMPSLAPETVYAQR